MLQSLECRHYFRKFEFMCHHFLIFKGTLCQQINGTPEIIFWIVTMSRMRHDRWLIRQDSVPPIFLPFLKKRQTIQSWNLSTFPV